MNLRKIAVALAASLVLFATEATDAQGVSRTACAPVAPAALRADRTSLTDGIEVSTPAARQIDFVRIRSGEEHHDADHEEQALFSELLQAELTTGMIVGALLLALGLGALHSLSPGHGKALVAAYLVGSRGTVGHAIALGGIVTLAHVFSVIVLGVVALVAADYFVPEKLAPVLGAISGVLIVGVGLFMFRRVWRARRAQRPLGHGATEHSHELARQQPTPLPGDVTLGSLIALGVSGGMVPCPSALVVLLTAIAFGRIGVGLALVFAFSLGLALVLMVIGVLLVTMQGFVERIGGGSFVNRAGAVLPLVSATIVTGVGVVISWRSIVDVGKVFS
jgi:ABC-type nickel/cobalt efflux system permease component RcnA